MSLKRWMLGKVNETGAHTRRGTQRRIPPSLRDGSAPGAEMGEPAVGRSGDREREAHLGPYAPLIAAIRDELEQFAASQLRLHLAIAERDRYVLTSVEVECTGSEEHRTLLRRFIAEFRPEQIKHYLARDIIAGLRNASAIDLTQFAGLNAAGPTPAEEEDPYRELLADLQSSTPGAAASPFEVTLVGRWSPTDAPMPGVPQRRSRPDTTSAAGNVHTPLSGRTFVIEAEDAGGARRIDLASIVPGRRYVIGKDGGCDVVVEGVYASRRHCEIWFDRGTWWVADAGSTNGIRVEASGSVARADPDADRVAPIELPIGASLVLSARARGSVKEYPRVAVHAGASADAKANESEAKTAPVTPIAPPRPRAGTYTLAARMSSGVREAEVAPRALPFTLGRSRNQTLIVDWDHNEVSGRHLEIVAVDDDGASVIVHGDNGVDVDGTHYAAGAQFRWQPGQVVQLGRAQAGSAVCTLTLARAE